MQTYVDDDARGAHALHGEHPKPVGRIVEIPEIGHQSFGIQRPAFAVSRVPVAPAPHIQLGTIVDRYTAL